MNRFRTIAVSLSGNVQGMVLMFFAVFLFGIEVAMIRHVTNSVHPFEVAFFRNVFGLLVVLPWFVRYGIVPLRTPIFRLHMIRACLSVVGGLCLFYAISVTPLARIAALGFLVPIFTTIGAILFLGERVSIGRWAAIAFGFVGTFIIIRPGFETIDLGTMLRIFASLIFGGLLTLMKVMTRTDSSVTITTYAILLPIPMFLFAALFFWEWPNWETLGWLAVMGIVGTTAQLIFAQALRLADANVIMPLDFFQLVWSALFGFLIFSESPNRFTFIGGFMIFASTTGIAWREGYLARSKRSVMSSGSDDAHGM